jgi:hypothetical protein
MTVSLSRYPTHPQSRAVLFLIGLIAAVFAMAPALADTKPVGPEGVKKPDHTYLLRDLKLHAKVTIVQDGPPLPEVLHTLSKATGLSLSVAKNLESHYPALGGVTMRNAPAWMVMKLVAEKDLEDGRWEKIEGGYRLIATRSLREKPVAGHPSQPEGKPDVYYLTLDQRLWAKLSVQEDPASLNVLQDRLQQATGLSMTLADNLQQHNPQLGGISFNNARAWELMKLIEGKDLKDGRWEKTPDGYRLAATASLRERDIPVLSVPWWQRPLVLVSAFSLALAAIGFLVILQRSKRKEAKPGPAVAKSSSRPSRA